MKKVVFAGCSFTAGNGWKDLPRVESSRVEAKDSPYLWTNLCYQNIEKLKHLDQVNVGQNGATNTEIFQNVVDIISQEGKNIDVLFCQWTAMLRYTLNVGFELWDTSIFFRHNENIVNDVYLTGGDVYSKKYLDDLLNRFKALHNFHWEILKIVEYTNIISRLANLLGIRVFFINGLCPWDKNYFVELNNVKPEAYTPFTKKYILKTDSRNDEDNHKLYTIAHQHYQNAGGINESNWINLYNSMMDYKVDVNFDRAHPGINSNKHYYQLIARRLQELNF